MHSKASRGSAACVQPAWALLLDGGDHCGHRLVCVRWDESGVGVRMGPYSEQLICEALPNRHDAAEVKLNDVPAFEPCSYQLGLGSRDKVTLLEEVHA